MNELIDDFNFLLKNPLELSCFSKMDLKIKKRFELFLNLCGGFRVIDILLYLPRSYSKTNIVSQGDDLSKFIGADVVVKLTVDEIVENGSSLTQVLSPKNSISFVCKTVDNNQSRIVLKYLNGNRRIIKGYLKQDKVIFAMGVLTTFNSDITIVHPRISYYQQVANSQDASKINPSYNLSAGITNDFVIKQIREVFKNISQNLFLQKDWYSGGRINFLQALRILHCIDGYNEQMISKANNRLKFDEFLARLCFARQVADVFNKIEKQPIVLDPQKQTLFENAINLLGFKMTQDQQNALEFIKNKLSNKTISTGIIQGDVGSGKTAVALLSCIYTVLCGFQACVVCPMTILCIQHFNTFFSICSKIGIKVEILTSKETQKTRNKKLLDLKNGEIDILISTHAVFEDRVEFKKLAIVIIDEQQKFGVNQRVKILQKGCFSKVINQKQMRSCDVFMMTATPIPRTMFMSLYHGIDSFEIKQKPANRLPIITKVLSVAKITQVVDHIKQQIDMDRRVYWVCPLIEESENGNSKTSVNKRFEEISSFFDEGEVDIIHGKIKEEQRITKMQNFSSGKTKILIATTVIEVGVDIKNASIIVVENSENFGLSVLHQLRGRVGRSNIQSYCYFLYGIKTSNVARQRLNILKNSEDGFLIAKEDLKLRGSGSVYGKLQSGFNEFRFVNPEEDEKISNLALNSLNQGDLIEQELLVPLMKIFKYDLIDVIRG